MIQPINRRAQDQRHYRRCHDCQSIALHASDVTPGVLCQSCGSQDTRRIKTDQYYLLQSCLSGYCGNSPLFWATGGGYTQWIDDAQWCTKEEAQKHIDSCDPKDWQMWPVAQIEACAKRTVDIQDLWGAI